MAYKFTKREKVSTPASSKMQKGFSQARKHSEKMSDYRAGKFPSVVATAESPFKENKADVDLKKLVSKKKVWPDGNTPQTTDKRYSWRSSKPGRKS